MAKKPKQYYDLNEEDRRLSEQLFRHDDDTWAHTVSVGVLISELLDQIPVEYLNRENLAERLLKLVLRDNHFYEAIAKLEAESATPNRMAILYNVFQVASSTKRDIRRLFADSVIQHSGITLTEQSDEILRWLAKNPYPFESDPPTQSQKAWLHRHMSEILLYLKKSSLCPTVCKARTVWPPEESSEPKRGRPKPKVSKRTETSIETLDEFAACATGQARLRDAILAYHHNISVKTLSNYLQNHLPKSIRKTNSPS